MYYSSALPGGLEELGHRHDISPMGGCPHYLLQWHQLYNLGGHSHGFTAQVKILVKGYPKPQAIRGSNIQSFHKISVARMVFNVSYKIVDFVYRGSDLDFHSHLCHVQLSYS